MKTLELLKRLRDEYIYGELDSDINEAISELEQLKNRSCMNCINNSFCGVYSFLKSVKNEDDEIDTFNCPQHTRLSKE